jgi:prephenate dehydrogenase
VNIHQVTIIGVGHIGGSVALALKKHARVNRIVGCDRESVLETARCLGVIDEGITDPVEACKNSNVVVLATPVGAIIDLIERVGPVLSNAALLTDVGSTKSEIVARARSVFGDSAAARFLPGHPMAGREHAGVEHADADLFLNAVWLVTPIAAQEHPLANDYSRVLQTMGARVVAMDPERHDHLCAWISHLPQMVTTAVAGCLGDEFGDHSDLFAIGGRALREITRTAASPYSMWRDIALTNTQNIQEALLRLEQRLAHIRENLRTRGLEEEFDRAHRLKK